MTLSVAFAEPTSAAKYKGKKSMTITVKDGKKTVKIKCKYKNGAYSGKKGKYIANVWKGPKQSAAFNGWNTVAKNTKTWKVGNYYGYKKPVTKAKLTHYQ